MKYKHLKPRDMRNIIGSCQFGILLFMYMAFLKPEGLSMALTMLFVLFLVGKYVWFVIKTKGAQHYELRFRCEVMVWFFLFSVMICWLEAFEQSGSFEVLLQRLEPYFN